MARSTLRRADRVSTILDRISSDGSVDARALAKEFAVSGATIRRDLQTLEDQKLLNRTHGGAIAAEVSYELPVRYRVGQHREEKLAIARTAVSRLPHGPLTVGLTAAPPPTRWRACSPTASIWRSSPTRSTSRPNWRYVLG
jgi:DeoR family transcriptional regulator, aga operon transcriptional repressor